MKKLVVALLILAVVGFFFLRDEFPRCDEALPPVTARNGETVLPPALRHAGATIRHAAVVSTDASAFRATTRPSYGWGTNPSIALSYRQLTA